MEDPTPTVPDQDDVQAALETPGDAAATAPEAPAEAGEAPAVPTAVDPAADDAAQAAGFADAAAKADFERAAAAAEAKPRRQRAPGKPKPAGFSVKAPTAADFDRLCGMAGNGVAAQFVLADGRKPVAGVKPAIAGTILRRGRPVNAQALAFTGAALAEPVTVTHVFVLEQDDKPTAQPLAIAELAAPLLLGPGEQFKIEAEGLALFRPAVTNDAAD